MFRSLTDHHQGVGLYLVKVTELFKKNTEFKILKINSGVVTAIHVAGVRGEPCGAVRWTAVQCQREVRLEIKIQLCYSLREY